jgi:hypothetical protein
MSTESNSSAGSKSENHPALQASLRRYLIAGIKPGVRLIKYFAAPSLKLSQAPVEHPVSVDTKMTLVEQRALVRHIKRSKSYLEYGSGYSTAMAVQNNVANIISIDTDQNYVDLLMGTYPQLANVNFVVVDIGPTRAWGFPTDVSSKDKWPRYPKSGWTKATEIHTTPDTVLIDGRFRVAAFCQSVLSAAPGTEILFDDYLPRPHYHVVESIIPIRARYGRIAKFVVPEISEEQSAKAQLLLTEYSTVPD